MADKSSVSIIPQLIGVAITIIVGVSLLQPITEATKTITDPNGITTTTTPITTITTNGIPPYPVNITAWVIIEVIIVCLLIGIWYFYHYVPNKRKRQEKEE
jgi:uncharacterized BrkB/YihY/UPF0761 family membrane protein